jgi:hypothetical protein
MNKKFTKLMAALALLVFMAPNMVGWGQTRDEVVAYTLTPASGSNNNYASNCDITINGITWNLTGNSTFQPWRIGGKSLTNEDRTLYSKTALSDNITKMEVTHGTASGITVNSWTVIVATNDDFSTVVSTLTPTFEASTTTTITRPEGADWTGCYYKFVYNVTVSGTSNKFLQFTEAKFYKESAATYTLTDYSGEHGSISFNPASPVAAGTEVTLTATPAEGYYFNGNWYFYDEDLESVNVTFVTGESNKIIMPEYNLYVDAGFMAKPTYGITCAVNNSDWGTLGASPTSAYEGQTVTLSYLAETGYRLSSIAITKTEDGSATGITPVESGDDFTFEMPAYAVTATATFEAIPTYTITFDAGTGTAVSPITGFEGSTITLLPTTPSAACVSRGWEFAGWATTSVSETTTAPTLLSGEYTITGNATLYAVYKVTEGDGGTFEYVFSEQGYQNAQTVYSATMDAISGIGWAATDGYASNTTYEPKYYTTGTGLRVYSNGTFSITSNNKTITAVSLTFAGDSYTFNSNDANPTTWSGSQSTDITWNVGRTCRLQKVNVTYGLSTTTYNSNPDCLEQVATPTFSLEEGTYTGAQNVTISCTTDGATILYKTSENGEWQTYSNAIPVSITTTIWAKATKEGMDDSDEAEATYTIKYTLTVDIEHVECLYYDYSSEGWDDEIVVDSEGHALVSAGAEVRISVEMVDDCYVLNGFNVTYGSTTIQATDHMDDNGTYGFTMPASNATLTAVTSSKPTHTLTVAGLEHVSFEMLVGAESSTPTSLNANHQATVCEDVLVEVIGLTVGNGFSLQSVTLAYGGQTQTITPNEFGVYAFNMPSSNATLTFTTAPITAPYYALYSGALTEGDYLIVYGNKAMNNTVESNRLQYETVTVNGTSIMTDDATIIWHIAPSGDYWTIYNADAEAYAASTGTKNQAKMLADGTDDKALWTVSGSSTYEFVNKYNSSNSINANLRNNGTYGFACYASSTGGALSLYKKVVPEEYTTMYIQPNQWYFIASPTGTSPTNVEALSDLYYYDEQDHHWRNQKVFANSNGFINFDRGQGFLCANAGESVTDPITLTFTGVAITDDSYTVDLDYHATTTEGETNTLAGWNLVGNPFNDNATLNMDCYILSGTAINTTAQTAGSYTVAPCEGVLVKATEDGQIVTFTKATPGQTPQPNQLQMTVAQQVVTRNGASTGSATVEDNAIVSFNEGNRLEKFAFNADAAKLYIPQNGKEYAIVSAEAQGEMPVNFRATKNGTYTLTINPEGVEMNYLHLIDNMTGANIDLLQTPSYTFNASMNDYESRFKLVFAANSEDGVSTGSTTFAFFANGELIVNNEGEATLQVVDMMGRILSSQSLNGNGSVQMAAPVGVYVLRLISGNEVKTQKIVVR